MTISIKEQLPKLPINNGIAVARGYDLSIKVEHGQLIVKEGADPTLCRQGRFSRVSRLRRLIVLGHYGYVTLAALRWCQETHCAFAHIDMDGELISCTVPPGYRDPRLLRAQAIAPWTESGMRVVKTLISDKLNGQLRNLQFLGGDVVSIEFLETLIRRINDETSIDRIRILEAAAGEIYWQLWEPIPIQFAKAYQKRIPEHWQVVGPRTSVLTRTARKATSPAHALFNLLYGVASTEVVIALLTLGLEPSLGIMHADEVGRNNLALDVVEPLRPEIDRLIWNVLSERTFAHKDFFERSTGEVRVALPLAEPLVRSITRFQPIAEKYAQQVATVLGRSVGINIPSILHNVRYRHLRQSRTAQNLSLPAHCRDCGKALSNTTGRYCADCWPLHRREVLQNAAIEGRHVSSTPEANQKRRHSISHQRTLEIKWDREHAERPSREVWTNDILPRLIDIPRQQIIAGTGLSKAYASRIRKGEVIPHPRHWERLRELASI